MSVGNMENQRLFNMLKTESMEMTPDEIVALLEEELGKEPEQIDYGLVERCTDALSGVDFEKPNGENEKKKVVHFNYKKVLLVAAVISIIVVLSSYAFARETRIDANPDNVQIVDGHFRVSLHDKKPDLGQLPMPASELPAKMHDLGVCNSLLPQELLSENWIVTEFDGQKNLHKELIAVALANQKTDQSVRLDIRSYVSTRPSSEPQFDLKNSYTYVEEIDTEKATVIVAGNASDCMLMYAYDSVEYSFFFDDTPNLDEVREIAKSIK